jgi:hypothetical protein
VADAAWPGVRPVFHHDFEFSQVTREAKPAPPPWTFALPASQVPDDGLELSAWLVDARRWKAHRIQGKIVLPGS